MSETLALLKQLIQCKSMTPNDAGCQKILIDHLKSAGFQCNLLPFGDVNNFWAWHGNTSPTLVFAGHTDVVPPGDLSSWKTDPFTPTEQNGHLFGRGATDMKSGLSAMVIAAKNFVAQHPNHADTIGFIVTSDEEGPALNGTQKVIDYLQQQKIKLDYCLVGEATSNKKLGDAIKIGRRGSMHGDLTIFGKQGHIAYPHLANNPIHRCFEALHALTKTTWDNGNEHFTPTSFQIYNIHSDAGAQNVIPGLLNTQFNFRYAPIHTTEQLQQKCEAILKQHELEYELHWNVSSQPYYSGNGKLAAIAGQAIQAICQVKTEPNTYGGTSDGRFIAQTGCEVVELGPINETAHKVNESISIQDLEKLTKLYQRIIELIIPH